MLGIRSSMCCWGLQAVLRRSLVASLQGHVRDRTEMSWTEHIIVTPSAEEVVTEEVLRDMRKSWFDAPVLAMPILHAVVLLLATSNGGNDGNATSCGEDEYFSTSGDVRTNFRATGRSTCDVISIFRWLGVAYLVQTMILENDLVEGQGLSSSSGKRPW